MAKRISFRRRSWVQFFFEKQKLMENEKLKTNRGRRPTNIERNRLNWPIIAFEFRSHDNNRKKKLFTKLWENNFKRVSATTRIDLVSADQKSKHSGDSCRLLFFEFIFVSLLFAIPTSHRRWNRYTSSLHSHNRIQTITDLCQTLNSRNWIARGSHWLTDRLSPRQFVNI